MTQKEASDILKTGINVFLTGAAGSGKTHVLREYLSCLKDRGIAVGVTASTGIAATHMGGMTIHSWAGIGVKDELTDWDIDEIAGKEKTASRIAKAKVLIIDEISMLHSHRLDLVDRVLRYVKNSDEPFGGIQTVVCGDFFQLPPVKGRGRSLDSDGTLLLDITVRGQSPFAYNADAWKRANFAVCYLDENHRQKDQKYIKILNAIRQANVTEEIVALLEERFVGKNGSSEANRPTPTRLYSHNENVDFENDKELSRLKTPAISYEMKKKGNKLVIEAMKKNCLAPEILRLKEGAKVMFVKNNPEKGYVNGTMGIVKRCTTFEILVQANGKHISVDTETWHLEDNGKVIAEIEQYPLRLAWAITIHKSQGMSLSGAEVDLSKSFEKGMGYVALSRVRSLEGLTLSGLNKTALAVDEEVLALDKKFQDMSREMAAAINVLPRQEMERRQKAFLGSEKAIANTKTRKPVTKRMKRYTSH